MASFFVIKSKIFIAIIMNLSALKMDVIIDTFLLPQQRFSYNETPTKGIDYQMLYGLYSI